MRLLQFALRALCALLATVTTASNAQMAGTYRGLTVDGLNVQVVVEPDANTGILHVTQTYWETKSNCKRVKNVKYLSYFLFVHEEIRGGVAAVVMNREREHQEIVLSFNGPQLTGTAKGTQPFLSDPSNMAAEACHSGLLPFAANFWSASTVSVIKSENLTAQEALLTLRDARSPAKY